MAYSGSTNFSANSFGAGATNYTGEVLQDLITYAAQENETYKEGLIHIKSGIQKRYTLPGVSLGEIIQDRVATPVSPTNSKGTFQFSERYLEPNDFMIYTEFDPRDMENYYKPFQPVGPLVFRTLDPKVQATMIRLILSGKDGYVNHAIWCSASATQKAKIATTSQAQGATSDIGANDAAGPMKYFEGAICRMLMNANATSGSEDANSGKVQLAGTGQFASGQAVHTELYAMWTKVPAHLRKKPGLKILMDYATWDKYDLYMSENHHKYSDDRKENEHMFHGKRIVPLTSLPEDTIIIGNFTTGPDSNLWMGIDYANDEDILQIDKLQANSELYFFKALMKMDVNIVRPSEIVAHLPFTYTP